MTNEDTQNDQPQSTEQLPTNQTNSLSLPEGEVQLPGWGPLSLDGPMRVLVLPDIHLPYHNLDAVKIAVMAGLKFAVDTVLVNGDALDFYELSKFCKDPRARKFREEVKLAQRFFEWLREQFPSARRIYKLGNHEERYESYMMRNCQELLGLEAFELKNVLRLDDAGVELVKDKRVITLGDLNVIHGHEYRFAISNPVNPARGLFLRAKDYAMCGHFHQKSEHTEGKITGQQIATWSTGCLCDLHPAYMPINNWIHGFAMVEVANNNKFHVQNKVVRHGKIY